MASSLKTKYPLLGEVHVDECFIGGEETQKRGRSKGKKRVVVVALEKLNDEGVGSAYAQIIDNASSLCFLPFFDAHISKEADVVTDEWTGYVPLKGLSEIETDTIK